MPDDEKAVLKFDGLETLCDVFVNGRKVGESADLVISGLVGFVPKGAEGFVVDPLFPASWDYLVLENLRYHGHDVDIRWQRGKGLCVLVDGKEVAQRETCGRLSVKL